MPIEVLKDAFFEFNSVDLSDHVQSVTISYSAELLGATVMGDTSRRRVAGLKDWSMTVALRQDFDASKVDATIFSDVGVERAVKVRKSKTDAISSTNPEFQGNGMVESYPPLSGGVGGMSSTMVSIMGSDGVALVRDTTP